MSQIFLDGRGARPTTELPNGNTVVRHVQACNGQAGQGCTNHDLAPSSNGLFQITFPLAWHHMIPDTLLRDLFNSCIALCTAAELTALLNTLFNVPSLNQDLGDIAVRIVATRDQALADHFHQQPAPQLDLQALAERLDTDDDHWFDTDYLSSAVSWPPWNMVQGPSPQIRPKTNQGGDDPGNALDDFSQLNNAAIGHAQAVNQLHQDIEATINQYALLRIQQVGNIFSDQAPHARLASATENWRNQFEATRVQGVTVSARQPTLFNAQHWTRIVDADNNPLTFLVQGKTHYKWKKDR